jgi:predicted RNA-binding Zn-ribbon protein involved in translation (DUF1610 family)
MIELIPVFADYSHPLINEEIRKAMRCPECGAAWSKLSPMTENTTRSPRYMLTCTECKFQGPFGRGLADAVKRWNKPPGLMSKLMKLIHKRPVYTINQPVIKRPYWTS